MTADVANSAAPHVRDKEDEELARLNKRKALKLLNERAESEGQSALFFLLEVVLLMLVAVVSQHRPYSVFDIGFIIEAAHRFYQTLAPVSYRRKQRSNNERYLFSIIREVRR